MYKSVRIIFIFIFISNIAFGQNPFDTIDFTAIDEHTKTISYSGNISKLVDDLTKVCTSDIEKSRAIYFWITDNISYDYKTFNKNKNNVSFKCKNQVDCDAKYAAWRNKYIHQVLKNKKGICAGYAELFDEMCELAGIACYVVEGYTKSEPYQIGKMGDLNHAWNVMIIDGNYYYLDLTWASGYCTNNKKNKLDKFYKKRNEFYWLAPIDKLSRDHFPKDTLQLVNSKYNTTLFKNNPYINPSIITTIDIISPKTGVINAKVGDTIYFKFKLENKIDKLQINTNVARNPSVWKNVEGYKTIDETILKRQKYIDYEEFNNMYSFSFVVTSPSIKFVEVLFDHRLFLKYLIQCESLKKQ
uniref:transglutaminase domain-containing protein n=2 Tax=Flavobacterium sp. TaxID=239 RepID=UPI00404906E2